jgi:ribosomal protein S14
MQLNYKDKKKRSKVFRLEDKKKCLKSIKINKTLMCSWWSRHKLCSLEQLKIKNRCVITQKGRSVKKPFKLSRIELKRWVKNKILFGINSASW